MKKLIISTIIVITIVLLFGTVFAVEQRNIAEVNTTSDLIKMKDETNNKLSEYEELYGSKSYGMTAYVINKVRIYSIPLCFIGIAIGAMYQYVIGTRRLDVKHKGFAVILTAGTILVICQVLPLIFTIVVRGWRG